MSETDERVRFGPDKVSLAPVLLLLFGTLPLATSDRRLGWLLLLPLVCAVWVLRARVVVTSAGLEVCQGLGVRRLPWEQVEGFDVPPRGRVQVLLRGGERLALLPLPREQRRRFLAAAEQASVGRRPSLGQDG